MSTLEPPSDLPRRGLSKLRRNNKESDKVDKGDKNSSTSSLVPAQDDSSNGIRASIDGALVKLKDRRRKSTDDRRGSNDSTTQSRLSRHLGMKSRRKSATNDHSPSSFTDGRTKSERGISPSPSELSLGLGDSGRSSLMTEDSDYDEKPARPTLSAHNSHAGYLTLSSPLINAQATSPADDHLPIDEAAASDLLPEPITSSTTATSTTAAAPLDRRISPSDRLKGAFTLPRRKATASTAESESVHSGGRDAAPLDNVFGGENRSSTSLVAKDIESTERLPQITNSDKDKRRIEPPSTPKSVSVSKPTNIIITAPSTPPNTFEPPTTFVTPPTPVIDQRPLSPQSLHKFDAPGIISPATSANSSPTTSLNSVAQRRKRAGTFTSSKLSNAITSSPLTPHIEEAKTPGGTLTSGSANTSPGGPGGFFSSVFSAAQNAANQLTNTLNTSINQNQKGKPLQPENTGATGGEEVIPGLKDHSQPDVDSGSRRQLAVETLGKGDLNLSHLGISEDSEVSPMTSQVDLPVPGQAPAPAPASSSSAPVDASAAGSVEESAAARAVSVAYEKPVKESIAQATGARPLSVASADGSDLGAQTPPRSSGNVDGLRRAGSVRSKISERRRRTRGSSAGTGASVLTGAITASTSLLANPGANGPGHRLTGFAVASSKRNKDFHQLFRSVPEDDYLIEDYSAALQRDILLHGRLYVSEGHICFSSNILGWVTNLVISFDEVVSVEKKSTAMIFPNAIVIQTLHARNIFASLVARDSTYDLLIGIWKISHPNLKSSLNGVTLDEGGTGDKTEKAGSVVSDDGSDEGSEDDVYDEDEDDGESNSFYDPTQGGSVAGSDVGDGLLSRKTSAIPVSISPGQQAVALSTEGPALAPSLLPGGVDCPGPASHAPTECTDQTLHYSNQLTDTIIAAPLGKIYSLMWGPQTGTFMRTFLVDQKSRDIEFAPPPTGLDNAHKEFVYSFIKPLNAPVGPRQTKCIVTARLEDFDLEKAVSVGCSTATPDVPSGGVFETKTRYCLMWGPGNTTRLIASCTVEWTGKSWLKGPIEKGANDGQVQYIKDLTAALKAAVAVKAPVTSRSGKKGPRSKRRGKDASEQAAAVATIAAAKSDAEAQWGLFEPVRGILEPVSQILGPMISAQLVIGVLVFLLAYSWFWPSRGKSGVGFPITTPDRLAAYEEIWLREESELWDWLEDRVGFVDGGLPVARVGEGDRQKVLKRKAFSKKLGKAQKDGKLEKGQVDDAIRVTEERLGALKHAVNRQKGD